MKKRHKIYLTITTTLFLFGPVSTGYAEKLSKFWQESRDHYNQLSDDACDGDGKAFRELLVAAIKDDHPVAQHDLAWVYRTERCVFAEEDRREATELERLSANAGYPVAQNNYAISLIEGIGTDSDPDLGTQYLERAIAADYGSAAATYAEYLLKGKYLPKDKEKAQKYYKLAQELGANQSALDTIAELLEEKDKSGSSLTASDVWAYDDGEAGWDMIQNGRLVARVFLGFNEYIHQYYYGFIRVSNDPIIHFMGASISGAGEPKTELNMGICGGSRCLDDYEADNGALGSQVEITIPLKAQGKTINTFKYGNKITFRFQTKDSASNNNFIRYTLRLDGSRKAISKVEAWAKGGQDSGSDSSQKAASPLPLDEAPGAKVTTYFEGDVKHGDVLCQATETAEYPPYFFSELPTYLQELYTLDPTKRVKPASTAFLENAGTSIWKFGASEHLVMYKGGKAIAVRAGVKNGAEQKYEGTWGISAKGITVRVAGNPGYNTGNRNFSCKGGTMALDTMSTPGKGSGGYTEWKGCTILTICDDWYDNSPSQIRTDVKTMRLVEWSPGTLSTSQMRWVQEAIKPR